MVLSRQNIPVTNADSVMASQTLDFEFKCGKRCLEHFMKYER